ncbi:MAG: signal recognition particle-docking protein FtsY, partial [Bradymonadaceae bacterium]
DEEAGEETDDETEQPEGESRSEGSTEVEPEADRPGEESVEGAEPEDADTAETDDEPDDAVETDEPGKSLEEGLEQTREGFFDKLGGFFEDESLDEDRVEEIEEFLFSADVGPRVAQDIIDAVEEKLSAEDLEDPQKIWGFIRHYCRELLQQHEEPLDPSGEDPFVILVVGVNGVGKTTTIGKMASKFKKQGHSVMLVAGDTFRAAAVEQLEIWAERTGFPMHRGEEGADPSSVIYEGIERAEEEDRDVVICDTSGRLHTDENLMDELAKMERVAGNAKEGAPHEVNLVLDANTGQNAIQQAKKFHEHLDISGLTLTKFDGTARGGVILGVCKRFEAPVRYIGIGERVADLREFDAEEFVEALFL